MDSLTFVQTIEAELKQRNIKKAEFYEKTGISSATFSQWRNRIYSPSSANIKAVENFLGISVDVQQKENPTGGAGEVLDDVTRELYDIWNTADDDEKRALLEMARLIKKRRT